MASRKKQKKVTTNYSDAKLREGRIKVHGIDAVLKSENSLQNTPSDGMTIDTDKFPRSRAEFEAIKDQIRQRSVRRGFDDGHLSAREEAKKQQKYLPRDDQRVITLMIAIEKIADAQAQLAITASGVIKYMTGMDK